jgi:hypothetical protein
MVGSSVGLGGGVADGDRAVGDGSADGDAAADGAGMDAPGEPVSVALVLACPPHEATARTISTARPRADAGRPMRRW